MLSNIALPMFDDNYLWLLVSPQKSVIAIDVGDYALLIDYLQAHQLTLTTVLITHRHHDHTNGLAELRSKHPQIPVYGHNSIAHITHALTGGEILNIKDFGRFLVLDTKGHTQYHLAYYHLQQKLLYCGDSLFSGGCGRIFPDGSAENSYHSLQKISLLPEDTQVCGSHEYTLDNLAFAQHIEPNNLELINYQRHCQQLRQQNLATLPSTLRTEKRINPFLRCHLLGSRLADLTQQSILAPIQTFCTLRRYKGQWTA